MSCSRETLLGAALLIFSFVVIVSASDGPSVAEWNNRVAWETRSFVPVQTELSDLGHVTSGQIISKLSTVAL